MSLPRYCAILGTRDPFAERKAVTERALSEPGMYQVLTARELVVISDAQAPLAIGESSGFVLGPIRSASADMPAISELRPDQSRLIAQSHGAHLIERFWGDYVAFLGDTGSGTMVMRAPFGALGCVLAEHRGLTVVASDLAMLRTCTQRSFEPDWTMVANHLAAGGLRQAQSCVSGVTELLWGMRFTYKHGECRMDATWSPWQFAQAERFRRDADVAAEELQACTLSVIGAQAKGADPAVVMLSGGLDSSIVAASVAASGAPFTCLNLTSGDSVGDERPYARMVAEMLGVELVEAEHELAHVDIRFSHGAGLVRPLARSFSQAARHHKQRIAAETGAKVIFGGGGGDNLFCFLQSVTPVADRLLAEGFAGAWRSACDMAELAETSVLTVARRALRRAWLRGPAWRWPVDHRFLTNEAVRLAGPPHHRWLDAPRDALPGSAAHIALLVAIESQLESGGPVPERAALVAQPLAELCLSIPSWLWCREGYNRVIARKAFASMLPAQVVWRRSKGAPAHFVTVLYEANRGIIGPFLTDGLLASQGLIDRDAVRSALALAGPIKGHDHFRLLGLADVEAWARSL